MDLQRENLSLIIPENSFAKTRTNEEAEQWTAVSGK